MYIWHRHVTGCASPAYLETSRLYINKQITFWLKSNSNTKAALTEYHPCAQLCIKQSIQVLKKNSCVICMTDNSFWFQGYVFHVLSTSCEWITAVCVMGYFLTFVPEFRQLSMEPIVVRRRLEVPATANVDVVAWVIDLNGLMSVYKKSRLC